MEIMDVSKTNYVKEYSENKTKINKEEVVEKKQIITEKEVENIVKKLNKNTDIDKRDVKFEKSQDTDKWIIKVYDPESGDLIRQIPEKEIIQIAKNIDDLILGGMVSGMDTASIIDQLMGLERQPVYKKQDEIQEIEDEKKIWGNVNSKLTSFNTAASNLSFSSTFGSKLVSSTDEDKVTATATSSASNTNYVLEDVVLAKAGQVKSEDQIDLNDGIKANIETDSNITDPNKRFTEDGSVIEGSFKINGKTISVKADDTINLVITKINGAGAGVKASFNSELGKFKIEQSTEGESKKIEIDGGDTSNFLTEVGLGEQLGETIENGENPDYLKKISEVDAFSTIESGFFTINDYTFELDKEEDTLNSIISKINSSDAGVLAFYDNDSKTVSLTAKNAGDDITLENDTSNFLTNLNLMNQIGDTDETEGKSVYEGTDATFKMNGVEFTKENNEFTINDVNIKLKSATETGEKITLGVSTDNEKALEKIEKFITKYNDLVGYLESKTGKEGALQGDSTANTSVDNLLITAAGIEYTAENIITSGTPDVGEILLNTSTGDLTLAEALEEGEEITATYDYKSGIGISEKMKDYLKPYTRYSGVLDQHTKMLDAKIDDMNDWILSMNSRLTMREDSLKRQFGAMESAMQTSQSQGEWLAGQLGSM